MGLLKREVSREFIAVPDDKKNQIVFKWPDINIRRFSKAIVEPDEIAVFLNTGQVCQAYDTAVHFFNRGCRAFHTFSRMRCCASSVGWSWSC